MDSPARSRAAARPRAEAGLTPGSLLAVGWSLLLTAAALWPLARPGELMLRDMVVPVRPPLTDAALGLGGAAARATPQDALLALAAHGPGAPAAAALALFTAFMIGGVAASELARRALGAGAAGQLAASTITLWNPFVVERLLQGHWSLVAAAVLLPAIALAGALARPGWRASLLALAGLTPTGALLGAAVALTAARGARDRLLAAASAAAVSAPWLIAAALGGAPATADPAAAGAFAARAEHLVGTLGALAGLGGIWNAQVVPGSREHAGSALTVVLLLALFAIGARAAWGRGAGRAAPVRLRRRLIALAAVAVLAPALAATGPGLAALAAAQEQLPGAGLLRDGQKWVALALPGYGLLAAAGAETLAAGLPDRRRLLAGAVAALTAMAAVPELPRAVAPLAPQPAWPGWQWVTGLVAMDDGAVASLPAASYRVVDGRPVYDPATKILPAEVLGTPELLIGGVAVDGAAGRPARVRRLLLDPPPDAVARLATEGVAWVLVADSPGPMGGAERVLDRLELVHADARLRLHHVPGPVARPARADRRPAWAGLAAWAAAALAGPAAAAAAALSGAGRRRRAPAPPPRSSPAS